MSLALFENINAQLQGMTKELAYHIVGDPLVVSNLKQYLDVSYKYQLKVNITTTANNLKSQQYTMLMHPTLKQVNFSINSYNANSHKKTLEAYLSPIIDYIQFAKSQQQNHFINLRIWNLDEEQSAKAFNQAIFDKVNEVFDLKLDLSEVYEKRPKNIKIAPKIFFNFDDYFEWPSLEHKTVSTSGFCYGLDSHFGILCSGVVVPCCLDKDGIINLGNVRENTLENILRSQKVCAIQEGFKNQQVVETLCQKCSYRQRFDETNRK